MLSRRSVLKQVSAVSALSAIFGTHHARAASGNTPGKRKFTMDLTGGAIGVQANQAESIELASQYGFESVAPNPGDLDALDDAGRKQISELLQQKGLVWGAAGLPVEFRRDEQTFREGMKNLPRLAASLRACGVTRVGTWLRPYHDELTYVDNFRQHARRLRECTRVLGDNGQRFGLEYVGPKTLWTSGRHSFIHSMAETKNLIAEVGEKNLGFVLDSWHWYTARETADDLRTLTNQDVVACDLNDAPTGIEIDKQIDNQRHLPAATGIIDLKSFLSVLIEIGYDGPVRSEPFNAKLNALPNDQACSATATAMQKAFALVGG